MADGAAASLSLLFLLPAATCQDNRKTLAEFNETHLIEMRLVKPDG
jgi:hypothetical protein